MSQAVGYNWPGILNAIQTWVTRGSGLPPSSVYWSGQVVTPSTPPPPVDGSPAPAPPPPQNFQRPPAPCISMKVSSDWLGQTDDEIITANPDSTGTDGQELIHAFNGQRLGTLVLTCYATSPIDTSGAVAILQSVLDSTNFPSIYDLVIVPAGIGIINFGKVSSTEGVINKAYNEPRATVTIEFSFAGQVSETGTTIQTVTGTNQITDTTYEVPE